ncbi:hypothetical protein [Moorena sp. SIO3B2]|uniref:hypothetical protein n=1 Tax=Moorena sp. SIO3B2 TaxID=2607827 RepID=UPI0013C6302A|nr:hypothetical protein [Moorena sp. SIO3B2]NEP34856.1 hypothetical protein [Moorena sp. SIO3B2]
MLHSLPYFLFRPKSWLVKASINGIRRSRRYAIAFLISLPKPMQHGLGDFPHERLHQDTALKLSQ